MTSPRIYRAEGLTLRKASVGEADLISSLYSREHGKLEVLARGARRLTSRLMGHFEPLTLVRLSIVRGRSLDTVAEAEVINAFPAVKAEYASVARGLYVAELIDGFSAAAAANPPLFDLALQTLDAVGRASGAADDDPAVDLPLRYFDLQLLRLSGFLPELYQCVECGADLEPERHRFAAGAGGALCSDCATPPDVIVRPLSLSALKVLRLLHRTESPDGLPRLDMPASVRQEVHGLLTETLQHWLDRQLRSQAFLDATEFA
ncbi:MAG: DNA repair protein RecO [Chloroflexi bacterium]|nr:DNA repair protein RecO [Chloroflexota bacterium]MYD48210.1 DNA repair protein RecO [Chloroflexota bacterium]